MKSDSTRGRPKTVGRPDAAGGRRVFAVLEQLVGPLERSLPGSVEVVLHNLAALSGVGKSTLLGMMARYTKADVNVKIGRAHV